MKLNAVSTVAFKLNYSFPLLAVFALLVCLKTSNLLYTFQKELGGGASSHDKNEIMRSDRI